MRHGVYTISETICDWVYGALTGEPSLTPMLVGTIRTSQDNGHYQFIKEGGTAGCRKTTQDI
jgi:hypothetical protein